MYRCQSTRRAEIETDDLRPKIGRLRVESVRRGQMARALRPGTNATNQQSSSHPYTDICPDTRESCGSWSFAVLFLLAGARREAASGLKRRRPADAPTPTVRAPVHAATALTQDAIPAPTLRRHGPCNRERCTNRLTRRRKDATGEQPSKRLGDRSHTVWLLCKGAIAFKLSALVVSAKSPMHVPRCDQPGNVLWPVIAILAFVAHKLGNTT